MKSMMLEDCFPILLKDEKVSQLASKVFGVGVEEVLRLIGGLHSFESFSLNRFHDALLELLSEEGECIDAVELECLSSYSETTTFRLLQFGGVFWFDNLEFGNIGYFLTAEDATDTAAEEYGFNWNRPRDSPFVINPKASLDSDDESPDQISVRGARLGRPARRPKLTGNP